MPTQWRQRNAAARCFEPPLKAMLDERSRNAFINALLPGVHQPH